MNLLEARRAVGLSVRPTWATTTAHWTLDQVFPDGRALLKTHKGARRWERIENLVLTGEGAKWLERRRRMCRYCVQAQVLKDEARLLRHLREVHEIQADDVVGHNRELPE